MDQITVSSSLPISLCFPDNVLTNQDLAERFGENPERIYRMTGVRTRHVLATDEIAVDIGERAATRLFHEHGIDPEEVDMLIYCSHGFEFKGGVTAALLHQKLGLKRSAAVMDLPQGCAGFVYGLFLAKSVLTQKGMENVLLITADMPNSVIHPEDFELLSLFGDGAAATLIRKEMSGSMGAFHFGTDGGGFFNLFVDGSHSRNPVDQSWLSKYGDVGGMLRGRMVMNSMEIFHFGMERVPLLVQEILKANEMVMADVDLFVFHQANGFMLERLRKKLDIPEDRFALYMEHYGNTVSASIPIALRSAMADGRIEKGSKVLVAGFGIGYCWGGTVVEL